MSGPTFDIVCTTIGDGSFLKHYAKAITEADARDRVRIIVIPDRKTPAGLYAAVEETREQGFRVECPDLNEQAQFLESLGAPAGMFPFDTDHRRNIGYLMAWRDGADIMVSVDDDNLPGDRWLLQHAVPLTGIQGDVDTVSAPDRFWNPGSVLHSDEMTFWPRGYPYRARDLGGRAWTWSKSPALVAINAGLWLGDPDVDAITRIARDPAVTASSVTRQSWLPTPGHRSTARTPPSAATSSPPTTSSARAGSATSTRATWPRRARRRWAIRCGSAPRPSPTPATTTTCWRLELELPDIQILDGWLDWLTALKPTGSSYLSNYEHLAQELAAYGWFRKNGALDVTPSSMSQPDAAVAEAHSQDRSLMTAEPQTLP